MNQKTIYIGGYKINDDVKEKIYRPYLLKLKNITKKLSNDKILKGIDFNERYYTEGIFLFRLVKRIIMTGKILKIE